MSYRLSNYHYVLPEDRIAQHPVVPAHDSKLLVVDGTDKILRLSDHQFFELPKLLDPDTLLIANNSQVFASRIILRDVQVMLKDGKEVLLEQGELLIVRVLFDDEGNLDTKHCVVWFSDKKHCRPGYKIIIPTVVEESSIIVDKRSFDSASLAQDDKEEVNIIIHSREFVEDGILIELEGIDLIQLCEQYGDMPLPPYITQATAEDKVRYKTSFGQTIGSVATPTAGLHFTDELRQKLKQNSIQRKEITLHVGIGTFAPVVSEDIRNHALHAEYITIDATLFETIYRQKIS